MALDDAADLLVGAGIVAVERGEDDGAVDAGGTGAAQIRGEWGHGVGRFGHYVTGTGVAVDIDDHGGGPLSALDGHWSGRFVRHPEESGKERSERIRQLGVVSLVRLVCAGRGDRASSS